MMVRLTAEVLLVSAMVLKLSVLNYRSCVLPQSKLRTTSTPVMTGRSIFEVCVFELSLSMELLILTSFA